ncbi:putative LRR receptor-like serine/threonine-protein kinase RLK [Morella rubra]|uniref:Putative LRR receptor-like serine/threonine-protein kinase RLK n=1 Tax=Morella rubra TaxID=262757 RepID=A0A6A1VIH4_9ROSI|nr:putative LRR receptor-like serine/threonine-protein kinase RLK [Morella rubra]
MATVPLLFLLHLHISSLSPISLSLSENQALLKLKRSFTHADDLSSWVPDSSPCSAKCKGVICSGGIITGLHLAGLGNRFFGDIPPDFFSHFTSLKKLWLSHNQLMGTIPESVTELPHIIQLHLENNQFTGGIPPLNQTSLKHLDLSNNKLEGEIPKSLSVFATNPFDGYKGLCGKPLDKYKDDNFSILGVKEMEDDQEVKVHVPSSNHSKEMKYSTWLKSDLKKGSSHGKNGIGDLLMLNDEKGTFGMADLMKAAAEVLGNGGLGSAGLLPPPFPPTSGLGFTQEICGKTYVVVDV